MFNIKNVNDELFGNVLVNLTRIELRNLANNVEKTTEFKNTSYISEVRNRSAKNTYIVDDIEIGVNQKK